MNKETSEIIDNYLFESYKSRLYLGVPDTKSEGQIQKNRVKMLRTIKEYSKNFLLALLYWAIIWFIALVIMYYQTYHT